MVNGISTNVNQKKTRPLKVHVPLSPISSPSLPTTQTRCYVKPEMKIKGVQWNLPFLPTQPTPAPSSEPLPSPVPTPTPSSAKDYKPQTIYKDAESASSDAADPTNNSDKDYQPSTSSSEESIEISLEKSP